MPGRESRLQSETPQGALDMLVLRVLVMGPAHGHTIAHVIERGLEDGLRIEHGLLFPVLHRLETCGWIASFWGNTADHRRARYYRLTSAGRRQLLVETEGRDHASLVQVWLGVSIALALAGRASAQTADGRPALEVTIEDRSTGGAEVGVARGRVSHIFATAGIRVVWKPRAAAAIDATGAHGIHLVMLSGIGADELFAGHGDVLAIAMPAISRVYVHYERVLALARYDRTPPGWSLGLVIAHEIAHVLLPDLRHTENGLMAARLSPGVAPLFTARDAQSLRARLHDAVSVATMHAP